MRAVLPLLLLIALASGARGQALDIERVETPASVASGAAVEIALQVRVRNTSDSNKRYALTAVVDGREQARWTSSSALRPGATERVPLAWRQAVAGTALRGSVVLLNTRGMEVTREDFEITVARGAAPPVVVNAPPIEPGHIPGVPRPSLPAGTTTPTAPVVRPISPETGTTTAMRQIDLGISESVYFHRLGNNLAVLPRNRYLQYAYIETEITNHLDEVFSGAYTLSVSLFKPDNGNRWVRTYRDEEAGWIPSEPFQPNEARQVSAAMGRQVRDQPNLLPYDSQFILWIDVQTQGDVQPNNNRVEVRGRMRDTHGFGGTTLEFVVESRTVGPIVTPEATHIFR